MRLIVRSLGLTDYVPVWEAMRVFTDSRQKSTLDEIWVTEHKRVFTQGQSGRPENIIDPGDIPVVLSDRGGQVTYHGPGQLVAYLMFDLRRMDLNIHVLVGGIEESIIDVLAGYSIGATRERDAPGVYVRGSKIGSLGLRVRRGCSFHGLSLNVAMDLEPFDRINPCGNVDLKMSQVKDCGGPSDLSVVAEDLIDRLSSRFQFTSLIHRKGIGDSLVA
ncbi:MAG: lipoyl(octanoyl) transferase LipB [Pseudomonadota bacterium]|nr:lipoyl(octanoyl) transferase LipB [Pseudomonadota bacterium]